MNTFINALLPVFGLIVVGVVFKYYRFPGDTFWPMASRITYFVLFPALLINRLATAQLEGLALVPLILAIALPILAVSFLLLVSQPFLRVSRPAFTSIFQGSIRFNTYVGLAAVAVLYGSQAVTIAAVALVIFIPLVNILCVTVLIRYGVHAAAGWRMVFRSLVRNPLIIACVIGFGLSWLGIGSPLLLGEMLDILSRAALPMGLLTVGADLNLHAVRTAVFPILLSSSLKLLGLPLLTLLACRLLHVDDLATAVIVLFAALPTATSAYILAQQLGGDEKLMAGLLTVQTLLAILTMPLVAAL